MTILIENVLAAVKQHESQFKQPLPHWFSFTDNQRIWRRFEYEANQVWNEGRRHYAARTICEYIRHETQLSEQDPLFKISNNIIPDLALLYMILYPERQGFFSIRRGIAA